MSVSVEANVSSSLSVIPTSLIFLAVFTNLSGLMLLIFNRDTSAPLSIINVIFLFDSSVLTHTKFDAL